MCVSGITTIGEGTEIYPFASIGCKPQDLKYRGEKSEVIIGKNNSIREYVTINPGTENGIMKTVVGDNNLLMAYVHVAHDCVLGNGIVCANAATLAGHVTVNDHAVLGGLCAIHQWVRIGTCSMVGGMSGVERDVIPYSTVEGNRATVRGLNVLGLKRRGASLDEISCLKKMLGAVYEASNTINKNIENIDANYTVKYSTEQDVIDFIKSKSRRSFCQFFEKEQRC